MVGRREWWEARKGGGEEESTVVGVLHRQNLLMLRTSGEVSGRPGVKGLEPRIAQPEKWALISALDPALTPPEVLERV